MAVWTNAEEAPPPDGQLCWIFNKSLGVTKARYVENGLGPIWEPDGSRITHWMPREPDPDEEKTALFVGCSDSKGDESAVITNEMATQDVVFDTAAMDG